MQALQQQMAGEAQAAGIASEEDVAALVAYMGGEGEAMRVFIDTNALISAALFPGGAASRAYYKAVSDPYDPVVSDYVIDELRRVFSREFPQRMQVLDAFMAALLLHRGHRHHARSRDRRRGAGSRRQRRANARASRSA